MVRCNIINKLISAQKYALSIKPAIGGFPVLAEILRQAGVLTNRWYLPSAQSIYHMVEGNIVQQGEPLITGAYEIPAFNEPQLIRSIRKDQQGLITFSEFLSLIWESGVISYEVDFIERKVTYYGIASESYLENYPLVTI